MEEITTVIKPAAGPKTPIADPEKIPTIIPPMIPSISPEKAGASDANAIPRHRGTATKNTTKPAGASCLQLEKKCFMINQLEVLKIQLSN